MNTDQVWMPTPPLEDSHRIKGSRVAEDETIQQAPNTTHPSNVDHLAMSKQTTLKTVPADTLQLSQPSFQSNLQLMASPNPRRILFV